MAVLTLATLAGCGDVAHEMPTVTGAFGKNAKITLPKAGPPGHTVQTLIHGDGDLVRTGDVVDIQYSAVTWPGGQSLGSSFGQGNPIAINAAPTQAKGLQESLVGKRVGSRVMIVLPQTGQDETGAPTTTTAVFVIDIMDIAFKGISGAVTPPGPGLPSVTGRSGEEPIIAIPSAAPPKKLVVSPIVTGSGAQVKAGDQIVVQYVGNIWEGNRPFDSSWSNGSPASFVIGKGQIIPGWDKGLVGQRVGSRVLLVIPPADGYGKDGNPQAGIAGTDTLVFVVDILGIMPKS